MLFAASTGVAVQPPERRFLGEEGERAVRREGEGCSRAATGSDRGRDDAPLQVTGVCVPVALVGGAWVGSAARQTQTEKFLSCRVGSGRVMSGHVGSCLVVSCRVVSCLCSIYRREERKTASNPM